MARGEQFAFGDFTLDLNERRLERQGRPVALTPTAFDILAALVRNAGRLVTKHELMETVWRDRFVEEGALAVHVSALRKALNDSDRRYIETVARAGYRFAVSLAHPPPRWRLGIAPCDPRVYDLVGRGRAHLLAASPEAIPKAIEAFMGAIALDAAYSPAHAGLALAYCDQARFRLTPHRDAYERARAAALRALAINDASADAQVALGTVQFLSDWNWTGAERSLQRSLELNPDHTQAYLTFGHLLEVRGRLAEGLAMKERALERDPHSALVHVSIALSHWFQRDWPGAVEWAGRALALNPRHLLAREFLAGVHWETGDFDAHMREMILHAQCCGVAAGALEPIRAAFARGGREAVVRLSLENTDRLPEMQLALLYGELGELDAAFTHLDRALAGRDPCLVDLAVAPQFDHLRADPRFAQRVAWMGL
jgi:DNA-binding winged helix-turn-helix (wHTH) protein